VFSIVPAAPVRLRGSQWREPPQGGLPSVHSNQHKWLTGKHRNARGRIGTCGPIEAVNDESLLEVVFPPAAIRINTSGLLVNAETLEDALEPVAPSVTNEGSCASDYEDDAIVDSSQEGARMNRRSSRAALNCFNRYSLVPV
jgi:hypothetical protein